MKHASCLLSLVLLLAACSNVHRGRVPLVPVLPSLPLPESGALDRGQLPALDEAVHQAIAGGLLPGAVLLVERKGDCYTKAFGMRALEPATEPMSGDTIFDLASLTKVIATAPSIALLHQRGRLHIDDPVGRHMPEFSRNGKDSVTIRHLLTHTSGLAPGLPLSPSWEGNEKALELACDQQLRAPPGTRFRYSDINFIVLGHLVHLVSGQPLDQFVREHIHAPLGMRDTGFLPPQGKRRRIAPTTRTDTGVLRGTVHDPAARRMGGVAGHAGLFSTAGDLAVFARMLLDRGRFGEGRILHEETVDLMVRNRLPDSMETERGLGWDIDSPYSGPRGRLFAKGSFGHTGWTGTSIWIDPRTETFVILLSNRNHPDEEGNVLALRRTVGTLAATAVSGYPFPRSLPPTGRRPAMETLNGIDTLGADGFEQLTGLRIGLITNHTGRDRQGNATIDLLHQAPEVDLHRLFSPEHGIRGRLDGHVSDSVDTGTGLPITSLYGATRKPPAAVLEGLDALVFDIQDIGCRFYTYISTMMLTMEAARESGLRYFVLDRINPISGSRVEGPVTVNRPGFVAIHPIPLRHGMTAGELARLFAAEKGWDLDLQVVPLTNWDREVWQDGTTLPWVNPSPNMRSLAQATLYPGIGLLEFADLSVGRGTPAPFERIGAPWMDPEVLVREIRALDLPGLEVEPITFVPDGSRHAGKRCRGVRFAVTDRSLFEPVPLGVGLAAILHRHHPDHFDLSRVEILLRHPATLTAIANQYPLDEIRAAWEAELQEFRKRREPHLLYGVQPARP